MWWGLCFISSGCTYQTAEVATQAKMQQAYSSWCLTKTLFRTLRTGENSDGLWITSVAFIIGSVRPLRSLSTNHNLQHKRWCEKTEAAISANWLILRYFDCVIAGQSGPFKPKTVPVKRFNNRGLITLHLNLVCFHAKSQYQFADFLNTKRFIVCLCLNVMYFVVYMS